MMMHKKLQKILAIALMTSFFSTSFIMGVSEAAPARHAGGQRPAQTQQVRPVHKSSSGHQARPAMHRSNPGHQGAGMHRSTQHHKAQPVMHKSGPAHRGLAVHKAPHHKGQPMMHKSGPAHHSPAIHKAPHHKGRPMMHRGGTIHHRGPVVVHRHHPAPPPPHHHHHNDHRSMHTGDWIGALVVGGIIGAIIANNSHHKADNTEYVYAD